MLVKTIKQLVGVVMSNKSRSKVKPKKSKTTKTVKPKIEIKELAETVKDRPMKLRFSPTAWAKLLFMRDIGSTEVGAFGITPADDLLYVSDIVLPQQDCTFATVEFDDESVANFVDDMIDQGRKPEQFLRIWIHTHPKMSAHPSQTDEETFKRVFGSCDWAVMAIISTDGDKYCRLQVNGGPFPGAFKIPIEVDYEAYDFPASDSEKWLDEHTKNVTESHYSSVNYYPGSMWKDRKKGSPYTPYSKKAHVSSYMDIEDLDSYGSDDELDFEDIGYMGSDFDFDYDEDDDIPKDLFNLLDANQMALLMDMSDELREQTIDDLKAKLKIGD